MKNKIFVNTTNQEYHENAINTWLNGKEFNRGTIKNIESSVQWVFDPNNNGVLSSHIIYFTHIFYI